MEREEFLFDSRAAADELVAAGIPRRQAEAFVRLLVRAIRRKLAGGLRRLEEPSDSARSDIPFDSRATADELVAAGVPERQVNALAQLLVQATKHETAVTGVI